MTEKHNIDPVFDENSRVLILGSFPSVRSREDGFFYAHKRNRFWQVISAVLGDACPQTVQEKRALLLRHGVALWDVVRECSIRGSGDDTIENVSVNDLGRIFAAADIKAVYLNGDTAYRLFKKHIKYDGVAVRLPSTSPANAAWSFSELVGAYGRIQTALKRTSKETPYYSLNDYAWDTFGKKLYRLSLDGGFTCPNRDGTIDTRGCIFCDGGGAGDFAGRGDIQSQLAEQKELIKNKLPKTKPVGYIAYFQSFTGTYQKISYLREKYEAAIADPEVRVLDIATRPDCLDADVLSLLSEFNKRLPVWVELGLQTRHRRTAEYIRRGYDLNVYKKAVKDLQGIGISQIITHVILGLPKETKKDMLSTVAFAVQTGTTGIKLSMLHVLKNTDLEKDYEKGLFDLMGEEEYTDILREAVKLLPYDLVVHRLTGDGNKRNLLAPLWTGDKKKVLNDIRRVLSEKT